MKAQEAHKMTAEEMKVELNRLQRHLYDLRSQSVTEKLEDPTQLRKTRREIARIKTQQRAEHLAAVAAAQKPKTRKAGKAKLEASKA